METISEKPKRELFPIFYGTVFIKVERRAKKSRKVLETRKTSTWVVTKRSSVEEFCSSEREMMNLKKRLGATGLDYSVTIERLELEKKIGETSIRD